MIVTVLNIPCIYGTAKLPCRNDSGGAGSKRLCTACKPGFLVV